MDISTLLIGFVVTLIIASPIVLTGISRKKREKNSLHGSTCFGQVLFAAFRDDGAAGFLPSFMQRIGEIGV